jgi:putative two-component system response regulator
MPRSDDFPGRPGGDLKILPPPPPGPMDIQPASITLLVVEDDDILREGLQILLELEGYQVITASQGLAALDQMRTFTPDLILSDITMPEMDGFQFYEVVRSRQEWDTIPFIFLTALIERDSFYASKRLGVEDYLVKPIDRQNLLASIRSRLERNQQLMLLGLERAYEAALIMLANAIELTDQYTRRHVDRVMEQAVRIGEHLQLSESQARNLRFGAILHDIGKIYIPERILRKPTKLDDQEWAEMKRHTIYGTELLSAIPYLEGTIPIIRSHHERWDGLGYPDGLRGESIPRGARIVSVADCFDAMTTDRIYHAANSIEQAIQEIKINAGIRYDPEVVEAFLALH